MNDTPKSTHRGLSLWHTFLGAVVGFGAIVITAALADRRYSLALVTLVVVALGLPVAARIRRLRASLHGTTPGERPPN